MMDLAQMGILGFGVPAIWLVGRREAWRRWGYVLGLASQPFWIVESWEQGQWGIFLISLFYTYSWCQGLLNFWDE